MKNKYLFILIIISIISIPVFFQVYKGKGNIKGAIVDKQEKPVPKVRVKLFNLKMQAGYETKADKDGVWKTFFIKSGQ